jgi:hypothetical protein
MQANSLSPQKSPITAFPKQFTNLLSIAILSEPGELPHFFKATQNNGIETFLYLTA